MIRLEKWNPEDAVAWDGGYRRIATRNLWISIPNLLCGFAVWLFWSIVVVQIQNLHDFNVAWFSFKGWAPGDSGAGLTGDAYRALLYTLPACAGLAGATLRIPNSFMIAISGGRNVVSMTSLIMIVPALALGVALQNPDTSFFTFVVIAVASGVGGGAFASSMSNISFFFPKRMQGLALGLNAGLGNVGVSVMQVLLPAVMTAGVFGTLGGEAYEIIGKDGSATAVFIQNCGLIWVPILAVLMVAAWFGMNNLPQHDVANTPRAIRNFFWLELLGYGGAAVGVVLWLLLPLPKLAKAFVILAVVIPLTVLLMRHLTPKATKEKLKTQFEIFRNKHNWLMTWLYIMTFGSFIGFSAAFPKLIADVFGYARVDAAGNVLAEAIKIDNAPNPFHYAWLGPLVGSLIRPVGGWISDKWGGARVTHWDTLIMIGATIGVGVCVLFARQSATPGDYFVPFLILFLVLFVTTGIGNGSTFRMVPIIFKPAQAGPVLGWTSAVAAYGAFLIPTIFASQLAAGVPETAFWGFAVYYLTCLGVNWWFYARKNAEVPC